MRNHSIRDGRRWANEGDVPKFRNLVSYKKSVSKVRDTQELVHLMPQLADEVNPTSTVILNLKIKNLLIYQIEKCERFVTSTLSST